MKNPFKKKALPNSQVNEEQSTTNKKVEKKNGKPKSPKPSTKKDVGKTSSADSDQAKKLLKRKKKKTREKKDKNAIPDEEGRRNTDAPIRKKKKERAPPARLVAATEAAPNDDDQAGGELTKEQIAVLQQVLGLKTQKQIDKFKSNFTKEEIAKVKKNLSDPSKRKLLKQKNANVASGDTGFAKYSGGPQAFVGLDPSKWRLKKYRFDGKSKCEVTGSLEEINAPIKEGVIQFITSPITYLAMMFQTNMTQYATEKQKYTLLNRMGTYQYRPQGTMDADDPNAKGVFTLLMWTYQNLPPFPNNELPMQARDQYTDDMTYQGQKLHYKTPDDVPVLPGRGMAIGDAPNLCVIRDVDPTDVYQGTVGDCWLLGAISSLAEFDGAIKRLFKKTKLLHKRPLPGPNMYSITLCDLETWSPVTYEIDERLPLKGDGSGKLLSCRLSGYGELWPALLEKAMAIHCGGWDAIHGGQCTHAWSIMTGCKYQYDINRNPKTGNFFALSKYNPNKRKWEKHYNNPKDDPGNNLWKSDWPKEGGGGSGEITEDDLFRRLCAWDDVNFIMSAATTGVGGESSAGEDPGLVADHAYSLIESHDNVAGTGIGLLKMRNPWGTGEIENGEFDDDGPGWDKYPQIKNELNPRQQDDGMFWVTREEFFRFFPTIYLSASNMTEFCED